MAPLNLESRYIHYLDDTHFKGYAEQLFFDNEKEYYKGMFQYLSMGLNPECLIEDKLAFEKIIEIQRANLWSSAQKAVEV